LHNQENKIMPMDPQLAALYGTDQENDTEKLAAAELAEELSEEGTFDPETASEEDVEALAQQFLAEEGEEGAEVEEPGEEQEEQAAQGDEEVDEETVKMSAAEEAQEKLAEADYLGRVMAHAYVQELKGIEKDAGRLADAGKAIKGVGEKAVGHAKRYGQLMAGGEKFVSGGRPGNTRHLAKGSWGHEERTKSMIARGATGATAVAAAAAARHHKKKHSSAEGEPTALDLLAERRAMEILEANGIELEAPEAVETEKTSASEKEMELLAAAVEQRAAELLEANGFQFENESAAKE
jgi:hypothetical protein